MNRFGNIGKATEENERRMKCTDAENCKRCSEDAATPHAGISRDATLPPTEYPTMQPLTEAEILSNDRAERFSIS